MSDPIDKHDDTEMPFLQRWSQRKRQHLNTPEPQIEDKADAADASSVPVCEQDLPPIESLHEDSEVSMFLSDNISETLQRQVLRKLFHMGKFNVCDGLDDYADDYNVFQTLGDILGTQKTLSNMRDTLAQDISDQADTLAEEHGESQQSTSQSPAPSNSGDADPIQDEETKES